MIRSIFATVGLPRRVWRAAAVGLLLAGCATHGAVEDPVLRNLSWFSYVGAEDVRSACAPGAGARYRFVYNAVWGEQVRTYDILPSHTGEGAVLITRVFGSASLTNFDPSDVAKGWRGTYRRDRLSDAEVAAIGAGLRASGFDAPSPSGTWLRSDDHWWAVAACRDGQFHYNAWTQQATDLAALPFVPKLLDHDATDVALRPPPHGAALQPFDFAGDQRKQTGSASLQTFRLQVGDNGLNLGPRWF